MAVIAAEPVYVADNPELIIARQQDWGVLGLNAAAHQAETTGQTLRIGETDYERGLGHHANGSITLVLDGQYSLFEAQAGVHPCQGGSVTFRILVDGQKRFESGTIRSGQMPVPIRVDVSGAQELRLEASDAGDGITCDMANWAEARLIPGQAGAAPAAGPAVDMARFARVVTWNSQRKHGATASRVEEFHTEDLFTETELRPQPTGFCPMPDVNGSGCIGLQWLNRRRIKELLLECASDSAPLSTNGITVEGWFGESAWQGQWKPLTGELRQDATGIAFKVASKPGSIETSKVRWVLPEVPPDLSVRLSAFTRSAWGLTNVFIQLEKPSSHARVTVWNGETPSTGERRQQSWSLSKPLELPVRYSRASTLNSDPTLLRFELPGGGFSVALADVLSHECVYLPDHGLFVARVPLPVTLADYQRSIAARRTILEEVRSMPDQTLAQAMARTHHEYQRAGPVLLSLACDNTKFDVASSGVIHFNAEPFEWLARDTQVNWQPWYGGASQVRPQVGTGGGAKGTRRLEGGWMPIVVIENEAEGIRYAQRTFVAPFGTAAATRGIGTQRSVCVSEFMMTNASGTGPGALPGEARLKLSFLARSDPPRVAELMRNGERIVVSNGSRAIAVIVPGSSNCAVKVNGGEVLFTEALGAGAHCKVTIYLPGEGMSAAETAALKPGTDLRRETEQYWRRMLAGAMQIDTPDELLNNLIRSSQVRCLIAARSEAAGARVAASIAAMAYGPLESEAHSVIRAMDFMGHHGFAQRSLDFFIHRYQPAGFLTTGYTTFGTAWHLWTVGEHCTLTRDTEWLRRNASELARVCHWVIRQLEKTQHPDGKGRPEYGLMPPGVLADWNAFAYHFAMNAYYAAGLRSVGTALDGLGYAGADRFIRVGEDLKARTLRAYGRTQSQSPALMLRNGTWIPHYPSQVHSPGKLADFFPGQDAGRSWCYDVELGAHQLVPTGVLDPLSREVERMMDHMEDVQFLSDGWFDYPAASNRVDWFHLGGFSKVQPYYTRNCEIYALRDDVKPFVRSYFNSIASLLNPEVLTFWEHFRHSGAWDKTHETGYFLHQTRTMLVQERGKDLWLAPLVPTDWLRDKQRIRVAQAPTVFGTVNYRIESRVAEGYIEATIDPPTRKLPRSIVLRLRHPEGKPIRSFTVNGKRGGEFDTVEQTIRISPKKETMRVLARF